MLQVWGFCCDKLDPVSLGYSLGQWLSTLFISWATDKVLKLLTSVVSPLTRQALLLVGGSAFPVPPPSKVSLQTRHNTVVENHCSREFCVEMWVILGIDWKRNSAVGMTFPDNLSGIYGQGLNCSARLIRMFVNSYITLVLFSCIASLLGRESIILIWYWKLIVKR